MNDLNAKLENINARITLACEKVGRHPGEVCVLAVSKLQPAPKIRQLYAAGQIAFGENYIQEALQKQAQLDDLDIEWHFIGPIQSNKTGDIARHFQWVQSVDREKILHRLSIQRMDGQPDLNVCLQVNIDREEQKSGALEEEIPALARIASTLPGLKLRGLMAIPRMTNENSDILRSFQNMQKLFSQLRREGLPLDTLSMGMSADFEQAIHCGSTMIRVGTDLFGRRA